MRHLKNFATLLLCVLLLSALAVAAAAWSGSGTSADPYCIGSAADLAALATEVNNGNAYEGCYFVVTQNIDLSEYANWSPIGNGGRSSSDSDASIVFSGIFNGGEKEISGLSCSEDRDNHGAGLFGVVKNGVVKNVKVVSGTVSGVDASAGVVAILLGTSTVEDCQNGANVTDTDTAGGVVGRAYGTNNTVKGCTNSGSVYGGTKGGGVVGITNNSTLIENCSNSGTVTGNVKTGGVGGIVAYINSNATVKNCTNSGEVGTSASENVGGVVGYATSGSNENVIDCTNSGAVVGGNVVGGVVGNAPSGCTVTNSDNSGSVTSNNFAGGILGGAGSGMVADCENTATVNGALAGGVIGQLGAAETIVNCAGGSATITGSSYAGRLIGAVLTGAYDENSAYLTIDDTNKDSYADIGTVGVFAPYTGWGVLKVNAGTFHGEAPTGGNTGWLTFVGSAKWESNGVVLSGGDVTGRWTKEASEGSTWNKSGSVVYVASTETESYATLTEAFAAVQAGDTITLLQNVDYTAENSTERKTVDVSGVTIDLNTYTLTTGYTEGNPNTPLLYLLGDFTLKNGKVQATGSYGIFTGNVPGAVDRTKVAKIEDVEVLNGGINIGSRVELTNVTAVGNTYYAVWCTALGHATIKSGNYSSAGAAVLGVEADGSMTVEGGTFTAEGDTPMVLGGSYGAPLIKGGTFNKDMTTENVTLEDGMEWKTDGNGAWVVGEKPKPTGRIKIKGYFDTLGIYDTLQAAIDAYGSVEEPWKITLLEPWTESVTVRAGQDVVICLDYTLTNDAGKDTVTVENGGKVTFYFAYEAGAVLQNNSANCAAVNNAGTVDFDTYTSVKGDYALKNNGGTVRLLGRFEGQIETAKPADGADTITIANWSSVPVGAVMVANGTMVTDADENILFKQTTDAWCLTAEEGWYKCAQPQASLADGSQYADLQTAIDNAAYGEEVTLQNKSSSKVSVVVREGQKIILNANGKSLGVNKGTEPILTNNGILEITGNGTFSTSTSSSYKADTVVNNGTLTIQSGTFKTKNGYQSLVNNEGGTIIVYGGTFDREVPAAFVAEGYRVVEKANGTYGVVYEGFSTNMLMIPLGEVAGQRQIALLMGIDSLNYQEVGFDVSLNGVSLGSFKSTVVYHQVTDGASNTWTSASLEGAEGGYLFVQTMGISTEFTAESFGTGATVTVTPYTVTMEGEKVSAFSYDIPITYFFN